MEEIFNNELDSYLKRIVDTPTPSGFEQHGQEYFKSVMKPYSDSIYTDIIGNVIAHKKGQGKQKLMISAHIDEIGFMVKYIDDNGMLYIVPIGGIDFMLLPGLRLVVHHDGNSFLGIVGRKPIHLLNELERKNFIMEDTWLDLGFTSKSHALLSVAIGDIVTFGTDISHISDDYVVGHSLDNKIGSMILLGIVKQLEHITPEYDTYFVSTVQEEIGLRGSIPATSMINPDLAIIIDATHATDYPTTNVKVHGDIRLGAGPAICISPDTNKDLIEKLQKMAINNNINIQIEAHPNASGTEAKAVQLVRKGTKTGIVSFPVRYMHSPSEMVSIKDVNSIIQLLTIFCTCDEKNNQIN